MSAWPVPCSSSWAHVQLLPAPSHSLSPSLPEILQFPQTQGDFLSYFLGYILRARLPNEPFLADTRMYQTPWWMYLCGPCIYCITIHFSFCTEIAFCAVMLPQQTETSTISSVSHSQGRLFNRCSIKTGSWWRARPRKEQPHWFNHRLAPTTFLVLLPWCALVNLILTHNQWLPISTTCPAPRPTPPISHPCAFVHTALLSWKLS